MAIRTMARTIRTETSAVALDRKGDARESMVPTPDAGHRPPPTGAAREAGVTRSVRPWPSHVLRAATPGSDTSNAGTEPGR